MNCKSTRKLWGQQLNKIWAQTLAPLIMLYGMFSKNKTNPTSHPNIGSLKISIEEELNKTSEEFILKEYISFQRRVDTIIEKEKKMVAILSKFIVLCLSSYFVVYFFKLK